MPSPWKISRKVLTKPCFNKSQFIFWKSCFWTKGGRRIIFYLFVDIYDVRVVGDVAAVYDDDNDDDDVGDDAGDVVERHDSLIFDFCSATEKGEIIHGSKDRETAAASFVRKL